MCNTSTLKITKYYWEKIKETWIRRLEIIKVAMIPKLHIIPVKITSGISGRNWHADFNFILKCRGPRIDKRIVTNNKVEGHTLLVSTSYVIKA